MPESNNRFAAFSDGELVVLYHATNISRYNLDKTIDSGCRSKPSALMGIYKSPMFHEVSKECEARGIDPYACTVRTTVTVLKPVEETVTKDIE